MYEYQHGGNAAFEPEGRKLLDFSANINPLGPPKGAEEAIKAAIADITRYPDSLSRELRENISKWEQWPSETIFCGNGASDIIFRLAALVKPKKALVCAPTFSDYKRALTVVGAEVKQHYLYEERGFVLDKAIIEVLKSEKPQMVFICNPNNPTGVITEQKLIEEIVNVCSKLKAIAVIDECFIDFLEDGESYTAKPFLKKYENLVILKAFTKVFAMPGIRLGYALCGGVNIVQGLYETGPDWTVSNIAQAAGIKAIKDPGQYIKASAAFVKEQRELVKIELTNMGLRTFDSRANYLFFKCPWGIDLVKELENRGIRIRGCGNYAGLSEDFYRVAISTASHNSNFLEEMAHMERVSNSNGRRYN